MTATQRPTRAGYGAGAPAPAIRPDARRPPGLRLVRADERTAQAQLRRRRLVVAAVAASVCTGLFGVVAEHAILAQQQFRLAHLQTTTAEAAARNQALQLQVAQLESPGRIVSEARSKLGMVPPAGITYLVPGHPGAAKVKGQPAVTPTTQPNPAGGSAGTGSSASSSTVPSSNGSSSTGSSSNDASAGATSTAGTSATGGSSSGSGSTGGSSSTATSAP